MLCFHLIRIQRYGNTKKIRMKAMEIWVSPNSEWSHTELRNLFCMLLKPREFYLFNLMFFWPCIMI